VSIYWQRFTFHGTRSLTFFCSGGPNLTWRTPDSSPNSAFDFEAQDWGFAGNSFDLIHAAQLCGAISSWPRFLEKAKRYSGNRTSAHLPRLTIIAGIFVPKPARSSYSRLILHPGAKMELWHPTLRFTDGGISCNELRLTSQSHALMLNVYLRLLDLSM
jgi:hypothetical protein